MSTIGSISELTTVSSVYAMLGGQGRGQYVAHVGIAKKTAVGVDGGEIKWIAGSDCAVRL